MGKKIICLAVCLSMVVGLLSALDAPKANAAEDVTPPELVNVEILTPEIEAGQPVEVKITVRESETGLARATIHISHVDFVSNNENPLHIDHLIGAPLYSNGDNLIEYTITVPSFTGTLGGQWYIGRIELYDKKGNYSPFEGSIDDKVMYKFYPSKEVLLDYLPYVKINQSNVDTYRPIINSVKIINTTVEKPGSLLLEIDASLSGKLSYAQFNVEKDGLADQFVQMIYEPKSVQGNIYTFEIPIAENRHLGQWQVTDIRLYDVDGRNSHYTNQIVKGYFVDYNNPSNAHPTLNFAITGVQGDEAKPSIDAIRVLNKDQIVEKPGTLKVAIDITEEQSGVVGLRLNYERIDGTNLGTDDYYGRFYFVSGYGEVYYDRVTLDNKLMTGTHELEIPVFSTKPAGRYRVTVSMLQDAAENRYEEYIWRGPSAEFTVVDEFEYAFEYGIGNQNLLSAIQGLQDGEVGRIMLTDVTSQNILTKAMLDSIAGQDKTLVCYKDGYQWIFRGKQINPSKTKDLNLTMRVAIVQGRYLSSGKQAVCLSFENNGELPGKVEFRFKSSFINEFIGKEELLRLFHVEGPKSGHEADIDYKNSDYKEIPRQEVKFKVVMDEKDAWCHVNLAHNSKYIVSDSPLVKYTASNNSTTNPTSPVSQPAVTVPPTTGSAATAPTGGESVPTTGHAVENTTAHQANTTTPRAVSSTTEDKRHDNTVVTVIAIVLGVAIAAVAGVLIYKHYKKK